KNLNLTDAQKQQIRDIMKAQRELMKRPLLEERRAMHDIIASDMPIYTALTRIDYSLVEASLDLGARPLKTFFSIIVPLTKGGIIA
ncbi:Spy/CpxP family protein refolding chaperone, partial [Salmonella enterica subsp. enterica serovar Cerro]|nr:Spy/CpxP family protein refolding chaperone [Salmonella enterica subsp. enterica serovar Cerro]